MEMSVNQQTACTCAGASAPRTGQPPFSERQVITDIALTYLISSTVAADSSPLSFMGASWFADSMQDLLQKQGLGDGPVNGVSTEDWLLYHALLLSSSHTILSALPQEARGRLCSLLAAPSIISLLTRTEWFGAIRSKIRGFAAKSTLSVGKWLAQKASLKIVKALVEKSTPLKWIKALKKDPNQVLQNVCSQVSQEVSERREEAERLVEESIDCLQTVGDRVASRDVRGLASEKTIDLGLRVAGIGVRAGMLVSMPNISPKEPERQQLSLVNRAITLSGMGGLVMPELLPLLMASPDQSGAELLLRALGPVAAYGSGYPLTTALATEVVARVLPESVKNSGLSKAVVRPMTEKWESILDRWGKTCATLRRDLHDRDGLTHWEIDLLRNIFVQISLSQVAAGLVGDTHPLWTALGATGFVEYLGLIGSNIGLLSPESTESQTPYLERVPLQVAVGFGATALEGLAGVSPAISRCVVSLVSVPVIADRIASSAVYQRLIIRPLADHLIPKAGKLRALRAGKKLMELADHAKLPGRGKAKVLIAVVGAGATAYKGYKAYHTRIAKTGLKAIANSVNTLAKGYATKTFVDTVAPYIGGPEMGLALTVISGRGDTAAAMARGAGLMTLAGTGSPFLASIAVKISDDVGGALGPKLAPIADKAAENASTVGRSIATYTAEAAVHTAVELASFLGWLLNDGSY